MSEPPQDSPPRRSVPDGQSRSGRRLTFARRTLYRLAVPVALALVRFWWRTCRVVRVEGDEHAAAALAGGPVVPVFWHQHQLFCVRFLLSQRRRGLALGFLISPSVDGELPALLAQRAGVHVLRGSSSNTGARALRDYYLALQQGISPAVTPDGPYGPRFAFKPGAIMLAQLSGRPMLPMAYCASRAWRFRNWDRFVLPWPFARIVVAIGAPRYVPRGLDAAALARWQTEMAAALQAAYRVARTSLEAG
ncbi:MAG TPA: lysophospholipid acyltransferase family protein [Steroidobacteraceae bacterium]|nr:lysophospholipid acyltransferase family protein [Steroidobacteraceae bacterium]